MSLKRSSRAMSAKLELSPKDNSRRRARGRSRIARYEQFEPRILLTVGYNVSQIQTAYGFNHVMYGSVAGNGAGQTIAIIDGGDDANFVNTGDPNFSKSDLAKFDFENNIPDPPSFTVVNQDDQARPTYAVQSENKVEYGETAGDVEWVHAIAPGANIVLIETQGALDAVSAGQALAVAVPDVGASVVSMSFGGLESQGETSTAPLSAAITSASASGGVVTMTIASALGLSPGYQVTIAGATPAGYNGKFTVSTVSMDGKTFTYNDTNAGTSPGSGGTASIPLLNDGVFDEPGVTYVSGSGDDGAPGDYPAASPNVLAVGATDLTVDSSGNYISETGWQNPALPNTSPNSHYIVVDDSDTTVGNDYSSSTSGWTQVNGSGYDGEYLTAPGNGADDEVTWAFTNLPTGIQIAISLTWVAAPGNSTNAVYSFGDGIGDALAAPFDANQTIAPIDNTGASYDTAGIPFQKVVKVTVPNTGDVVVDLDAADSAAGAVVADAVAISDDQLNAGGSGGGISQYEPAPAYQSNLVIHNGNTIISNNGMRTTPDVSIIGAGQSPVEIINSGASTFAGTPGTFAGTSLSAPIWAALVAIADQGRAISGLGSLTGLSQTMPMLYSLPSYVFNDILSGFNGYNAGPGYDLVTGLGTPKVPLVVAGLGAIEATGGFTVPAVEGQSSGLQTVATFENPDGLAVTTDINWGDGTADTVGTITGPNSTGLYTLQGSHTYANEGHYTITVHISFGPSSGVAVTDTATVGINIGLLLLDPKGAGALFSSGNGGINILGGGELVIDSNSPQAGAESGNGLIMAGGIDVAGKLTHSGTGGFAGTQRSETLSDPLAVLAPPTPSGATFKNTTINNKTVTLSPGTYIGGIHINGASKVMLTQGVYILQGGGLSISGTSTLTGAGVLIYNAPANSGDQVNLSTIGAITLSAPTTGAYQGLVFYQNRSSTAPFLLSNGVGSVSLTGVVYVPAARVLLSGSGNVAIKGNAANGISGGLIAFDIQRSGDVQLTIDATANSVAGSLPSLFIIPPVPVVTVAAVKSIVVAASGSSSSTSGPSAGDATSLNLSSATSATTGGVQPSSGSLISSPAGSATASAVRGRTTPPDDDPTIDLGL